MKKILHKGKYLKLVELNGWEYAERTNDVSAAIIIPLLNNNDLVFIREFRVPLQGYSVGFPAGLVGDESVESPESAAKRELVEETGYKASNMTYLTSGPPSSGLSNEILHFYLATDLVKVSEDLGVGVEEITAHTVPFNNVEKWLEKRKSKGDYIDPKVFTGLYFAQKEI